MGAFRIAEVLTNMKPVISRTVFNQDRILVTNREDWKSSPAQSHVVLSSAFSSGFCLAEEGYRLVFLICDGKKDI